MFFVDLAVYFLLIMIIIKGRKSSCASNAQNADFINAAPLTSLRGLSALMIVFLFISQEHIFKVATQIQIFSIFGPLLIATYFFCTGYEFFNNLSTKPDYLHGKNIFRTVFDILVPLCVTVILCGPFYLTPVIIGFLSGVIYVTKQEAFMNFFQEKYRLKTFLAIIIFALIQALVVLCENITVLYFLLQLPLILSFITMLCAIKRKIVTANSISILFARHSSLTFVLCLLPIFLFRFLIYRNRKPYFELFNYNLAIYISAVLLCTALMIILIDRIFYKKQKSVRKKEPKRIRRILKRIALSLVLSILVTVLEGAIYYFTSPSLLFIGHASVKLRTSSGKVIYIDPYYPTKFNYSEPADYILITHAHSDHNKPSLCTKKGDCKIITWKESLINKEYKIFEDDEIKIEAVPGGGRGTHLPSSNVGYIVSFDGVSVYHAADCDFTEDKYYLKDKTIDYALYTVNGVYTMGPGEATEMANYIGARINIPIHGDGDNYGKQRNEFNADGYMKLFINQLIFLN